MSTNLAVPHVLFIFGFQSLSSFLLANVYPTEPLHTAWTGFSSSFLTYRLLPESFLPFSFSFLLLSFA